MLSPISLADPFDVLLECEGNEALAAEKMGLTVADFYRRLENSEPDRVSRGLAARMTVTLARLMTTIEGALIDRINDTENPLSDANLVALLTRGIPALTELAKSAARAPAPGPHSVPEVPPAIQAIFDKINAEARENSITAGGIE